MSRKFFEVDCELRRGNFLLEVHEHFDASAVAVTGPPGCGKSTFLEAIAGVRSPDQGVIRVGGDVFFDSFHSIDLARLKRPIRHIPQGSPPLFLSNDFVEDVLAGVARSNYDSVERVIYIMKLEQLLQQRLIDLSVGARQRLLLAQALLAEPTVLLIDEPLVALDSSRASLVPYLRRIGCQTSIHLLYVTHNAPEIKAVADWVIILDEGRVAHSGPLNFVEGYLNPNRKILEA